MLVLGDAVMEGGSVYYYVRCGRCYEVIGRCTVEETVKAVYGQHRPLCAACEAVVCPVCRESPLRDGDAVCQFCRWEREEGQR
jgi:hypothetical protein